ncbi:S9 family peptidase [Sphingomonas sp. NSE70-1]|uniref:S9 family peptidase n=1 Tax=Sphingomonas caseinilyticus TaxID=2908205 RepID=A0ABT0RXW8_9SPHN|nr:S9 family peptidase [Sphingomonas caseinilyticus]MCL6699570.1 S9 family peptidase [Sphingomonas caseinilyticus]
MKHWRVALAVLALGTTTAVIAAPSDAPNPIFTGADLFNLSAASDPQISPDGRSIAYVRRSNDVMTDRARSTIWLIDVATGDERPLVTGTGSHSSPRWSPDGKRLAYVSTAEGGASQLYVRWMDSGQTARITGLADSPQGIAWSPDGQRIAYLMNVPDDGPKLGSAPAKPEGAEWAKPLEVIDKATYRVDGGGYLKPGFDHIFVVDALGGAPRQLTFGAYHDGNPEWTADGRGILFSAVRKADWEMIANDSEVYRLEVASGAVTALTDRRGPDAAPVASPDGRLIAYVGYDDHKKGFEQSDLYVMNSDGSAPRKVAAGLDRSIDQMEWAADGRSIIASYEEEGSVTVSRIGLNGSVSPIVRNVGGGSLDRPYAGGSFSVSRGGTLAYTTDSATRPADVSVSSGGKARQLTRLNDLSLSGKSMAQVRTLDVTAPDGSRVPSWILLPPGYRDGTRVPVVLEIHGGPYASYGPHFSTDYQLYAASGYAVLYTNPRGSTGYGQAFADGIEKTYPDSNTADLLAAVDAAVASGIADPENLFVTGGSGGGVLTAWLVGKTDRFKAAASQKPVINWTSMALTADGIQFFGPYWMGGLPWENQSSYWARSPLSLIGNVKTPTLVVVGAEDYRTPVSESEQLYSALKLKGVPTMLVKVPNASHGGIAARPSQSAAKASAIIAWFDKYRKQAGAAETTASSGN